MQLSFVLFLLLPLVSSITHGSDQITDTCDCGYTADAGSSPWTDMWHIDFRQVSDPRHVPDIFVATYQIKAKYENTLDRTFYSQNVRLDPDFGALQIVVSNNDQRLQCGGFGTQRRDFLYGSFRSYMRTTSVNGTVAAMYLYNTEQEIDIEILSAVEPPQSYFAIHPGLLEDGKASHLTHDNHWLGFDPSLEFHEYRFDWMPGLVIFYIDGQEAQRMATNIPNMPSRFMFNHWSDGNPNFSRGPPEQDAIFEVMNITAFFNYSMPDGTLGTPKCERSTEPCNINGIVDYLSQQTLVANGTTAANASSSSSSSDDTLPPQITASLTSDTSEHISPSSSLSIASSLFLAGCLILLSS